jgi:hypothetical protein
MGSYRHVPGLAKVGTETECMRYFAGNYKGALAPVGQTWVMKLGVKN